MSALHEAVARAIASAEYGYGARPRDEVRWCDERAAAAAMRVVLAEAKRAVEALPTTTGGARIERAEALAVLAALGERTAITKEG